MKKVIIASGRHFDNYHKLKQVCDDYFNDYNKDDITIVSGKAKGADALGENYAVLNNINIEHYPTQWDTFGKGQV